MENISIFQFYYGFNIFSNEKCTNVWLPWRGVAITCAVQHNASLLICESSYLVYNNVSYIVCMQASFRRKGNGLGGSRHISIALRIHCIVLGSLPFYGNRAESLFLEYSFRVRFVTSFKFWMTKIRKVLILISLLSFFSMFAFYECIFSLFCANLWSVLYNFENHH